jgi:hypothetical protein
LLDAAALLAGDPTAYGAGSPGALSGEDLVWGAQHGGGLPVGVEDDHVKAVHQRLRPLEAKAQRNQLGGGALRPGRLGRISADCKGDYKYVDGAVAALRHQRAVEWIADAVQ